MVKSNFDEAAMETNRILGKWLDDEPVKLTLEGVRLALWDIAENPIYSEKGRKVLFDGVMDSFDEILEALIEEFGVAVIGKEVECTPQKCRPESGD